ncbi:MAG: MFS transporter [Acutalibacteraceae bacterium]
MENSIAKPSSNRLSKRNLWTFSIGCIGRDMICTGLFNGQLLNYVYFTKQLTASQLGVLTVLMTLAKVFDAFNDPIMGNIIDATHTKWGKFKPWIFIGMLGTSAVVAASFSNTLQGWSYVVFFGIMYFIYSIVFTMNDIAYWGMIPSLAKNPDDRNRLSSLTALCANIGAGVCGIFVPILTTGSLALNGSAVYAYMIISIIFVSLFLILQSVTLVGVKEEPELKASSGNRVSLKQIVDVFKNNDQLRWISLVFLATRLVPGATLTMFIYFEFGYNGTLLTLFYVFSGLATVIINIFYPMLNKKLTRQQLLRLGLISQIVGNVLLFLIFFLVPNDTFSFVIPIFNARVTLKFILMAIAYFFCGFASTSYYMVLVVCIANTTEYNELLTGERNEGVIFATRAFLVKLGNAITTLFVMLFYIIIGIRDTTDKIAELEQAANLGAISSEAKLSQITQIISQVPTSKTVGLLLVITLTPIVFFTIGYTIFKKKFRISEEYYNEITAELEERRK